MKEIDKVNTLIDEIINKKNSLTDSDKKILKIIEKKIHNLRKIEIIEEEEEKPTIIKSSILGDKTPFYEIQIPEPSEKKKKSNGLSKPVKISDELKSFLNLKPSDFTEDNKFIGGRPQITSLLGNYIKSHNLQKGKSIEKNSEIVQLLDLKEEDQLTYFNLQNYLKKHFIYEQK